MRKFEKLQILDKCLIKFNEAISKYASENYRGAYVAYSQALAKAKTITDPLAISCQTGILQCQYMLGLITASDIMRTISELTDSIRDANPDIKSKARLAASQEILHAIQNTLNNPHNRAQYQYNVGCIIHDAIDKKQLNEIKPFMDCANDKAGIINYLLTTVTDLESACLSYQVVGNQNHFKYTVDLMAFISEHLADIAGDHAEHLKINDDLSGAATYSKIAKKYYLNAIAQLQRIGVPPKIELLFSPLLASSNIIEIDPQETQTEICFMDCYISCHQLDEVLESLDDDEEYRGELASYQRMIIVHQQNENVDPVEAAESDAKRRRLSSASFVGLNGLLELSSEDRLPRDGFFSTNRGKQTDLSEILTELTSSVDFAI